MEIEKMSDEELLSEYRVYYSCIDNEAISDTCEIKFRAFEKELLKRLSKNNIEEFKKKLIEKISKKLNYEFNGIGENVRLKEFIDLINNLK